MVDYNLPRMKLTNILMNFSTIKDEYDYFKHIFYFIYFVVVFNILINDLFNAQLLEQTVYSHFKLSVRFWYCSS